MPEMFVWDTVYVYAQYAIPLQRMTNVRGQSECRTRRRAEDRGRGFYEYSPCHASDQVRSRTPFLHSVAENLLKHTPLQ